MAPIARTLAALMFAAPVTHAHALERFPASDPRSVVQVIIEQTDHHAFPSWDEPAFFVKTRPYMTDDFLAVVAKGGKIASRKHVNLWDGDFFTGAQGLERAALFSAEIAKSTDDSAVVDAVVGTTDDPKAAPKAGDHQLFMVKRVAGVWKVEDIKFLADYAKTLPTVKTMFGDPARYGQ